MTTFWTRFNFIPAAALLAVGFSISASAQVNCTVQSASINLTRSEGNTEQLGDMVLTCTGGTPTAAGDPVPQVNFTIFLNTNITSKVTATSGANSFSEALMLIDEPNHAINPLTTNVSPSHPLLNCGQVGAPDKGPSGPGVCAIVSTGNPTQTYDGSQYTNATGICNSGIIGITVVPGANYGCGRPNAFQGRMTGQSNVVVFSGVPFDPPGAGTRIVRITNLRADAALLTPGTPISAEVVITGPSAITFPGGSNGSTPQEIGFTQKGLVVSTPSTLTVRVQENFAIAWKYRNVHQEIENAVYSAGSFVYVSPNANNPADVAQNVPGVNYFNEDGFQWQNNTTNAPPTPNPPVGFSNGVATDTNFPLNSVGYGGVNTGINADGVASNGTRIALTFKTAAVEVIVPSVVYLHRVGSPSTTTGVMVLTSTDANGAGTFTPGASTTIHNGGIAVYEVLYADPFAIEYADIECTLPGFFSSASVTANLAPFYTVPTATMAEPSTYPIPRFSTADSTTVTIASNIFGLIISYF
jgi:hypothetical protein